MFVLNLQILISYYLFLRVCMKVNVNAGDLSS